MKQAPSKEQIQNQEKENDKIIFPTSFLFFGQTNGIRKAFNTILGISSSGKSTLLKSIIHNCMNKKTFVWLSEESALDYCPGIRKCGGEKYDEHKDNLIFFSEKEINTEFDRFKTPKQKFEFVKNKIIQANAEIVFFDNITTSFFYSTLNESSQGSFVRGLCSLRSDLDIPFFFVAHTKKEINSSWPKLIEAEDTRGSNQLVMLSEYFYIIQSIFVGEFRSTFLMIKKHRFHRVEKNTFMLFFRNGIFAGDEVSSFNDMNKIFMRRNKIGSESKK